MNSPQTGWTDAVLSGITFYLISSIWMPFRPRGWDYLAHFGGWTLAYLAGFSALLVVKKQPRCGATM